MTSLVSIRVKSRVTTAPPGTPIEGSYYIIPPGASGAWAAYTIGNLAHYAGGAWEQITPSIEQTAVVEDESITLIYKGAPILWEEAQYSRERLTAARTLFARAAGHDDTGDGLTIATAFNTITRAILEASRLDTANFDVTVDAAEVRAAAEPAILLPLFGGGVGHVVGLSAAQTSIGGLIAVGTEVQEEDDPLSRVAGVGGWTLDKITVAGLAVIRGSSRLELSSQDVAFGYAGANIEIEGADALLSAPLGYKVTQVGGAAIHLAAAQCASVIIGGPVLLTTAIAFGTFVRALTGAIVDAAAATFTGSSIVGKRFEVGDGAVIVAGSDAIDKFPGDALGEVKPGGIYVGLNFEVAPVRHARDATGDPSGDDDETQFFGAGSIWINTVEGRIYACADPAEGAADWTLVGGQTAETETVRNPLINNFFQVWQRGTSFANPSSGTYTADRWLVGTSGAGATRTISRQTHPLGDELISGSPYFLRWAETVAGAGETQKQLIQRVAGVRAFAGRQVRLTVLAKASGAITLSGCKLTQNFGTGGSPSAAIDYPLDNLSIGTSWEYHSAVVTLNNLEGKALGSNANDQLQVIIGLPLNTTFQLDIAAVFLAEDGALIPTDPRSFEEELARCLFYYQKSFPYATAPTTGSPASSAFCWSANTAGATAQRAPSIPLQVPMRIGPSVTFYSPSVGGSSQAYDLVAPGPLTATTLNTSSEKALVFAATGNAATAVGNRLAVNWTADAEL